MTGRTLTTVIARCSIPAFVGFRHSISFHSGFCWFWLLFPFLFCDMYNTPIAYFLTFTVRGSWRHGDSHGSWKRNGQFVAPDSNVGSKPNKNPPHYFNEEECQIIENALNEVCLERQWVLHEKSVLCNHVHVVVTASDIVPENVMKLLKAKATMRLRKSGFVGSDEKIWTQHGSTKYLFDEKALQTVCEYVIQQKPEWSAAK